MTGTEPGDVVTVPFPFSDLSGAKRRPALILGVMGQEAVCMMLTSVQRTGPFEHTLEDW